MLPRARLAAERNTSTLTLAAPVSLPRRSNISRLVLYSTLMTHITSESFLNVFFFIAVESMGVACEKSRKM